MTDNSKLRRAFLTRDDEFFTRYKDIEVEICQYKKYLKGKVVYCNCDNFRSDFIKYFTKNFKALGLKGLITSFYSAKRRTYVAEYSLVGDKLVKKCTFLMGHGEYNSPELVPFVKKADFIITNPPFSKMRDFMDFLHANKKKFIILAPITTVVYKNCFPYFLSGEDHCAINVRRPRWFYIDHAQVETSSIKMDRDTGKFQAPLGNVYWFTNLDVKPAGKLELTKKYSPEEYPELDNFHAINVSITNDIPVDYDGVMAVPITFMHYWDKDQFLLVGSSRLPELCSELVKPLKKTVDKNGNPLRYKPTSCYLHGHEIYSRLFIRWKR